ncbi:MAG: protein kinase [Deltaproteobacteria bacterium]|nr:protein kinase [Deltaproteobacteria bacterium]
MRQPDHIGDYRIVDVLGRGGMGVVYRAQHRDGSDAAVKTVRTAKESTLESIRREIQTLRELQHPAIVGIRDHGMAEGVPWYAMDLLHGRTLREYFRAWFPETNVEATTKDLLKPGRVVEEAVAAAPGDVPPWSFGGVTTLFRAICEPLAYVHGQGVVHRDLSPVNVFLLAPDRPVLFDFGLAAQFRAGSSRDVLEVGGMMRGTAHYMSPEQVRGEVVDARSDIYALGCMLYEALTGRPPFVAEQALAVVMAHLEVEPQPPSTFADGLPRGVDDLLLRMLAKAPRDRLGYARDVATALERLGAAPVTAPVVPRSYTYRPSLAGRTTELEGLDKLLLRLGKGLGGAVALIGESGAGKTRLAAEVATRASAMDIRVITCECEPVGDEVHGAPLHSLRPLLRAIADVWREGASERALRGASVLAAYEPSLAELVPPLDEHIDPVTMRFRVLAVLRDVLVELAREERVLLVIDDLQLADELTMAFLQSLRPKFLAESHVMVLATVRAEESTSALDATLQAMDAQRVEVARLGRDSIGSLVRDMLALESDAPTLTDFISARSSGNPLFAAEYVRSAVDEGLLHRDLDGRWRVGAGSEYDKLPTPGSVQELIHRRLGGLPLRAREVAYAAAILGRTCAPVVLAEVADASGDVSRAAIAELIKRHVLEELPDGDLRFVHDKLREQAYDELSEIARRRYHKRAASALATRAGHAELAHHHEHAGDLERAVDELELAADQALAAAAFGEARTLLRRLMALPLTVPPSRRARWNRQLGEACFALGDLAGCASHMQDSLGQLGRSLPRTKAGWTATVASGIARQLWSRTLGRRPRKTDPQTVEAALAAARMTSCFFFNDDSLGLVGSALAAANLAERAGNEVPIAEIYSQLGYIAGLARLHGVANAYFTKARATADATRDPVGLGKALYSEAAFHVGVGAWDPARTAAARGLEIATELRNPQEAEVAHTILGHVEFATGDYEGSRRSAIRLYDSAHARDNLQHRTWGIYTQARAALYLGDLDAAIRDFEAAMRLLESQSDHASQILCGGMLASALARAGDTQRARTVADATTERIGKRRAPVFTISEGFIGAADAYLELLRRGDAAAAAPARTAVANLARLSRIFPIAAPAATTLAGTLALRTGSPRRAARLLRKGLALAERLHMPYDQAVAHAALAELGADGHDTQARALFRQLGCAWHLGR